MYPRWCQISSVGSEKEKNTAKSKYHTYVCFNSSMRSCLAALNENIAVQLKKTIYHPRRYQYHHPPQPCTSGTQDRWVIDTLKMIPATTRDKRYNRNGQAPPVQNGVNRQNKKHGFRNTSTRVRQLASVLCRHHVDCGLSPQNIYATRNAGMPEEYDIPPQATNQSTAASRPRRLFDSADLSYRQPFATQPRPRGPSAQSQETAKDFTRTSMAEPHPRTNTARKKPAWPRHNRTYSIHETPPTCWDLTTCRRELLVRAQLAKSSEYLSKSNVITQSNQNEHTTYK